ncbi:MAG TPA: zf-HC2 domain-containing protein [Thermoanaerobaculia bacterium]|nr:zf-HC2 domain-containing protein [Thermoanaerobaculia bacterium]
MTHPEPETLAAYHAGELDESEAQRLQDHLLTCRECAALLLDLDGLTRPGFGAGSLSAADQEALWGRIQREIEKEETPRAPAPVIPLRRPSRLAPPPRWLQALAAALLVATIGLSGWVVSLRRTVEALNRPEPNAPVIDLYSGASRSAGSPQPVATVPRDFRFFTVILHPPHSRSTKRYRVEIARAGGGSVWSRDGVAPDPLGPLPLTLTRSLIGPGEYRIRLFEETGNPREPLVDYGLRVEGP